MKLIKKGLLIFSCFAGLLATSCVNDVSPDGKDGADGKIFLDLTTDATVEVGTRVSQGTSPYVPNADEFSISLNSTDGSYSHSWKSIQDFNNETGFPMGRYIISASFGEDNQEGFSNPYFKGSANVNVITGQTTDVKITAALANSMVSVKYDSNFPEFFKSYFVTVETSGNSGVVFSRNETKPAYFKSEKADVKITLTNEEDKTVTLNMASIDLKPKYHYIVNFNLDGNTDRGYGTLTVDWSEELTEETKEINLTKDLFDAPEPSVTLNGCKEEESVIEGISYENINPEFHIYAYGGLKSAKLKITSDKSDNLPSLGSDIVLLGEGALPESVISQVGIDCSGIYSRISDRAVVNLKDFIKTLSPGTYTFSLEIEDSLGKSNTLETPLKVEVSEIKYEIIFNEKPDFLGTQLIVVVATNCEQARDQFKFQSWNSNKSFVDVKDGDVVYDPSYEMKDISTDLPFKYAYKLTIPEIEDLTWKVNVSIPDRSLKERSFTVELPDFTLEADAFATWVRIRPVSGTDDRIKKMIFERGKLFEGNNPVESYELKDDMFILKGLTPNKEYSNYSLSIGTSLKDKYIDNVSFKTEEIKQIPINIKNESKERHMYNEQFKVGGNWYVYGSSGYQYSNYVKLDLYEPSGWANFNSRTYWNRDMNGSNSWFQVPSTFINEDGNSVTIRTVGYNNENIKEPDATGEGILFPKTYCKNPPAESDLKKSIGELFLGEYSSETDKKNEGIQFGSRPLAITFSYMYMQKGSEKGIFEVKVFNGSSLIAEVNNVELGPSMTFIPKRCDLSYPEFLNGSKDIYLYISFKSSNGEDPKNLQIDIPSGDALDEGISYVASRKTNMIKDTNNYHALATGSVLQISNVELVYE